MRRLLAARQRDVGLEIVTLPLLAARLAGGFRRPATRQDLDPAIRLALNAGGFSDLERIRTLPGMTRAIGRTLAKVWDADLSLQDLKDRGSRLSDLALIEDRVRATLPPGVLTPRDLRDAGLERVGFASAVLGSVELDRLSTIPLVWRPLLQALGEETDLCWRNPGASELAWFTGKVLREPMTMAARGS